MKRAMIASTTAAVVLALGVSGAAAQQAAAGAAALILATLATGPTPTTGAFATLGQDNQKTARALYGAQKATSAAHPPLTLEQIAERRQTGQGWTEIFNNMKSQGLVGGKTLTQVMSVPAPAATTHAK